MMFMVECVCGVERPEALGGIICVGVGRGCLCLAQPPRGCAFVLGLVTLFALTP